MIIPSAIGGGRNFIYVNSLTEYDLSMIVVLYVPFSNTASEAALLCVGRVCSAAFFVTVYLTMCVITILQ